jgi:SAM-dependent methyltransferase
MARRPSVSMIRQHVMSFLKSYIAGVWSFPLMRRLAFLGYGLWTRKALWHRKPEIDRALGIDTTGLLPNLLLRTGHAADQAAHAYLGINANVLRCALEAIPAIERFSFVDLGAGKGRAVAVASAFPFRAILGIELNPELCRLAARNATIIAQREPARTRIEIRQGDASVPALPEGPMVVLLYHSFGRNLVQRLAAHLEVAARHRELFFVYVNPVYGDVFDEASGFTRWFAEQIPIPAQEDYFGDGSVAAVIWRAGGAQDTPSRPGALRMIVIVKPGAQARIAA